MKFVASLLLATTAVAGCPAISAPIPEGWLAQNIDPIAFDDADGHFIYKLTITKQGERWYLFVGYAPNGNDEANGGFLVYDVTEPTTPRIVNTVVQEPGSDTGQVTVHDNLLITNLMRPLTVYDTTHAKNWTYDYAEARAADATYDEGVVLYDVSDATQPKKVGAWHSGSFGTHRNSYPGGKYAYLSSFKAGFKSFQLVILDVSNPASPKQVSAWHQFGQQAGEVQLEGEPVPGLHGPAQVSPDGKTLVIAYTPNLVNLDITNPAEPKLIGKLQLTPPFVYNVAQSVHTAIPYWDRNIVLLLGEPKRANCDEALPLQVIVDNADMANPRLLSVLPRPQPPAALKLTDFCEREGRFGPHNVSTEIYNEFVEKPNSIVHMTYFNAGLQVFNIEDTRNPRVVGYFIPADLQEARHSQTGNSKVYIAQDTLSDTRGNIYMAGSGGLYILRDTGSNADHRK